MSIRTKAQILMEEWGVDNKGEADNINYMRRFAPYPPLDTWTTLRLPYQVPSCPPLPTLEQILQATKTHQLHHKVGNHHVCRIGDTVIKYSVGAAIVEEAENILFVAENCPQVRVPKILSSWEPHDPKFSWIDPKLSNMIAQRVTDDAGNEDWEVFLIDWEYAGWYPAWLQARQFRGRCLAWVPDRNLEKGPCGRRDFILYKPTEIFRAMVREFDPDVDMKKMSELGQTRWRFY